MNFNQIHDSSIRKQITACKSHDQQGFCWPEMIQIQYTQTSVETDVIFRNSVFE